MRYAEVIVSPDIHLSRGVEPHVLFGGLGRGGVADRRHRLDRAGQERERLRSYGYPEDYAEFGIQLTTSPPPQAGVVQPTVEHVTGRPARTFAQWAAEHADAFRGA